MNELLREFVAEATESMQLVDNDLVMLASAPDNRAILDNIFRMVHTIKGTCSFLGLTDLADIAHGSEDVLSQIRNGSVSVTPELVAGILSSITEMKDILSDLQVQVEAESNLRGEEPLEAVLAPLAPLTERLGRDLGKEITLHLEGADIKVDTRIHERITAPLVHLVRNAADHGLETPGERQAAGKIKTGLITVRAVDEGDELVIEVADDGRGLPLEIISEKAVYLGLVAPEKLDILTDDEVSQLVFVAGLTTASHVTDVSGRGVGLDVVRSMVEAEGGSVRVRSIKGLGSRFTMRIPTDAEGEGR